MTMAEIPPTELLSALAAKQEITEVLLRYCRGCDRADEAALRACFHPGSIHSHGAFKGLSADFRKTSRSLTSRFAAGSVRILLGSWQ